MKVGRFKNLETIPGKVDLTSSGNQVSDFTLIWRLLVALLLRTHREVSTQLQF